MPGAELVAVVDADPRRAAAAGERFGVPGFIDHRELVARVDAVSIAVPTRDHFEIAKTFLEHNIHVLLEKPMTTTVEQAETLIAIAAHRDLVLQVGHLERVSATLLALEDVLSEPLFIESHRLAPFKPRGTGVDVVLDLMIHDIDILRYIVRAPIANIDASGATVFSERNDIANARIRFENGCVANVTASRASLKTERKMRIFQRDAYIGVDFQNQCLTIHRKGTREAFPGVPEIVTEEIRYEEQDKLWAQIEGFLESVRTGAPPLVSGKDGKRALETAIAITRTLRPLSSVSDRRTGADDH